MADLKRNEAFRAKGESEMEFEIRPINSNIEKLRKLNGELEAYQKDYLMDNNKATQKKIDKHVETISQLGVETKELLTRLNNQTQEMKERGASDTIIRMRNNQFTVLSNRLIEVTKGTWDSQNKHNGRVKDMVARRIKIKYTQQDGTTLSDDEARTMAQQLVETNQHDQVFAQAREELQRVMRTYDEMQQVEKSMMQLHQMFCDLQILVNEQGEGIDVVQQSVEKSHARLEKGNADLTQARKHSKSCCTIS